MAPTPEEVRRIYERRFPPETREAKRRIWAVIVEGFLQRWIPRDSTILDVGCGHGEFLGAVDCARRIGVDLDGGPGTDGAASDSTGIEFHQGSATDLSFLEDASVDVVFTSNLLEHLSGKDDVERMLVESRRVLRSGGRFIALGPNLRFEPDGVPG